MKKYNEPAHDYVTFDEPTELVEELILGARYHLSVFDNAVNDLALKYEDCHIWYNGEVINDLNRFIGVPLYEVKQ